MKRARLWTTVFSLIIITFNLLGQDDKNLLLFLTNPLNLLGLEDLTPVLRRTFPEAAFWLLQYTLHFGFWFSFGALIDWLINRRRSSNKL